VVGLLRGYDLGHGAGQLDQFGVADPVGGRNDDLVARVAEHREGVVQRMFRAVGNHDLLGRVLETVSFLVLSRDGGPKLGSARNAVSVGLSGRPGGDLAHRSDPSSAKDSSKESWSRRVVKVKCRNPKISICSWRGRSSKPWPYIHTYECCCPNC